MKLKQLKSLQAAHQKRLDLYMNDDIIAAYSLNNNFAYWLNKVKEIQKDIYLIEAEICRIKIKKLKN